MFNTIDNINFGKHLKELRKKLKITQLEITNQIGINPDTIRKIENGIVVPKYDTLAALSQIYKVDLLKIFTEYQRCENLISLYTEIDIHIINKNIAGLHEIKSRINTKEIHDAIFNNLANKLELEQFKLYIEALILHLSGSSNRMLDILNLTQSALELTVPKFSINKIDKLRFNTFEIRILILYAISWGNIEEFALSNKIFKFVLSWTNLAFSDSRISNHYKIKSCFNISYNYHRLDNFEEALKYIEIGITTASLNHLFADMHTLYYRKFAAEYYLGRDTYMDSLKKCFYLMQFNGSEKLIKEYIDITKKVYDIDANIFV